MNRICFILVLACLLLSVSGCCRKKDKRCKAGATYASFFAECTPSSLSFVSNQGDSLELNLGSHYDHGEDFTQEWCANYDYEPSCPTDYYNRFDGDWNGHQTSFEFRGWLSNYLGDGVSLDISNDLGFGGFSLTYEPFDLSSKPEGASYSLHGNLISNGTTFSNVFQCHLTENTGVNDIYFARTEGVIQFSIIENGEEIVFFKQ